MNRNLGVNKEIFKEKVDFYGEDGCDGDRYFVKYIHLNKVRRYYDKCYIEFTKNGKKYTEYTNKPAEFFKGYEGCTLKVTGAKVFYNAYVPSWKIESVKDVTKAVKNKHKKIVFFVDRLGDSFERAFKHLYELNAKAFAEELKKSLFYMLLYGVIESETYEKLCFELMLIDYEWKYLYVNPLGSFTAYINGHEYVFFTEDLILYVMDVIGKDRLVEKNIKDRHLIEYLNEYKIDCALEDAYYNLKDYKYITVADNYLFYLEGYNEEDANKEVFHKFRLYKVPYDKSWSSKIDMSLEIEGGSYNNLTRFYCSKNRCLYLYLNDDTYVEYYIDTNRTKEKQGSLLMVTDEGEVYYYDENKNICLRKRFDSLELDGKVVLETTNDKYYQVCHDGRIRVRCSKYGDVFRSYYVLPDGGTELCKNDEIVEYMWKFIYCKLTRFDRYFTHTISNVVKRAGYTEPFEVFSICELKRRVKMMIDDDYFYEKGCHLFIHMLELLEKAGIDENEDCIDVMLGVWKSRNKMVKNVFDSAFCDIKFYAALRNAVKKHDNFATLIKTNPDVMFK